MSAGQPAIAHRVGAPRGVPWRRGRQLLRTLPSLRAFASFLVLLLAWTVVSPAVPAHLLPSPGAVLASAWNLLYKGILPMYLQESLRHMAFACVVAVGVGVPLGLLLGISRWVSAFFHPLIQFFTSLSGIAWLPMMLLWFGFGERTIIAVIDYAVIFPVLFSTLVGVRTVPRVYINAVRTMGGSRWTVVKDVLIPGALPNIITGIRLGVAYGWRALIAAEMLVGANGLGFMIFNAQSIGDMPSILLGMLIIGGLWLVADRLLLKPIEVATVQRWQLVRA